MQLDKTIFNEKHPLRDTGYSNASGTAGQPRHGWYPVKEAFSPQLVESAFEFAEIRGNDLVVDPFCGSGTVPLTASLKQHSSIGFEVNPFLAFVSQTKLLQCRPSTLDRNFSQVTQAIKRGVPSRLESYSSFSEDGGTDKWLFNREVLRSFEGGWQATNKMQGAIRDLFRMGLISSAMDSCNAYKDGKCLRYYKDWQKLKFGCDAFISAFEAKITQIKADLDECPITSNDVKISFGDSRRLLRAGVPGQFKLCITSPPYLNSFDYSDVYRPEMFLGKFVSSNEDLMTIRLKTLRSHVQASWEKPTDDSFGPIYKEVIEKIIARKDHLWDKNIPMMIQAYFEDIERILRELRSLAHPRATVWMVVSTSAYAGVEIPVDLIIAHIGSKVGWFLQEIGVLRHLRSSGQRSKRWAKNKPKPQLRESVVILKASLPPRKVFLSS